MGRKGEGKGERGERIGRGEEGRRGGEDRSFQAR